MKCKITNNKIKNVISFGKMPLANGFLNKKDFKKEFFYNLETGFSEKLSLFQLNDHPKPKQMFNIKYPFFTGSSKYMKTHFQKYSKMIKGLLQSNSKLVEIGSNDGTFLKNFPPDFIRSSELDFVLFQIERLYSFSINLAPIAFPIFPVPQSPIFFILNPFQKVIFIS